MPPKPKVTAGPRFAPLVKGVFVATQNGGGYVQQTTDPITCTFDKNGWGADITVLHYHWSGLDFGTNPPPDAATVTGVAHGPGTVTVACSIDYVANNVAGAQTQTSNPIQAKVVYVVGGPITLGVNGGISGTPPHDPAGQGLVTRTSRTSASIPPDRPPRGRSRPRTAPRTRTAVSLRARRTSGRSPRRWSS